MKRNSKDHSPSTIKKLKGSPLIFIEIGCSEINIDGFTCWVQNNGTSTPKNKSEIKFSSRENAFGKSHNFDLTVLTPTSPVQSKLSSEKLYKMQSLLKSSANGWKSSKKPLKLVDPSHTECRRDSLVGNKLELVIEESDRTKQLIENLRRKSLGASPSVSPSDSHRRKSLIIDGKRNSSVRIGSNIAIDLPQQSNPHEWYKAIPSTIPDNSRMQQLFCWCIQLLMQEDLDSAQMTLCKSLLEKFAVKEINTSWYLRTESDELNGNLSNPLYKEYIEVKKNCAAKRNSYNNVLFQLDSNIRQLQTSSSPSATFNSLENSTEISDRSINELFESSDTCSNSFISEEDQKVISFNDNLILSLSQTRSNCLATIDDFHLTMGRIKYDVLILDQFSQYANEFYDLAKKHVKGMIHQRRASNITMQNHINVSGLFKALFESFKTKSLINSISHEIQRNC